jgi:hypothetical protein
MVETLKLRGDAVDWRMVDGEVVALIRSSSTYIAVNHTGTAIWPALAEGASRDGLAELLVSEFEIDQSQAVRDVDAFVSALADAGLLEPR